MGAFSEERLRYRTCPLLTEFHVYSSSLADFELQAFALDEMSIDREIEQILHPWSGSATRGNGVPIFSRVIQKYKI